MKLIIFSILIWNIPAFAGVDTYARESLKWENTTIPDYASDAGLIAAYIAPPILLMNEDKRDKKILAYFVVQGANHLVTDAVKVKTKRMRPDGSNTRSFFSGHTSTVFTSAAFLCSVHDSSCGTSVAVAVATGYLRIAADKHWLSDVLIGALAGTITGASAPIFIRGF